MKLRVLLAAFIASMYLGSPPGVMVRPAFSGEYVKLFERIEPVADQTIRFPDSPTPEQPKPTPGGVVKLTPDLTYIIDSDVELIVLSSPDGRVKVLPEEGPLKIKARFVDNPGKSVTRLFKGKFIYTIEPATTGTVELIVVPTGVKSEKEVIRKTVDVDAGTGPQPPPGPTPPGPTPPAPTPVPPVNPLPSDNLKVLMHYDSKTTYPQTQHATFSSTDVSSYITNDRKGTWRCWSEKDDASAEQPWFRDAKARPKTSNWWIVISSPKGFYEGEAPKTKDDMLALLKKY